MKRKTTYRTVRCRYCGGPVTSNALGRAAHERGSKCLETRLGIRLTNQRRR